MLDDEKEDDLPVTPAIGASSLTTGSEAPPPLPAPSPPPSAPAPAPAPEPPPPAPAPAPSDMPTFQPTFKGTRGSEGAVGAQRDPPDRPPTGPLNMNTNTLGDIEKSDPTLFTAINQVAKDTNTSAHDLAQLVKIQSNLDPNYNQNGKSGYFALSVDDVNRLDPQGHLDYANKGADNLYLGALKWKQAQALYGRNTDAALAAFFAGPEVVDQMLRRPDSQQAIVKEKAPGLWDFIDKVRGYDVPDKITADLPTRAMAHVRG